MAYRDFLCLLDHKNTFILPTTRYPSLLTLIMVDGQHDFKMFKFLGSDNSVQKKRQTTIGEAEDMHATE